MRLTSFSVAIGLLTAAGHAADNPINVPKDGFPVFTAGKPATFTWKPTTDGTVTLRLREGASSDLNGGTLIKGAFSVLQRFLDLLLMVDYSQCPQHWQLHIHTTSRHHSQLRLHDRDHR